MQSAADFAKTYKMMSDGKLLQTANEGSLVDEAELALEEELMRRNLKRCDFSQYCESPHERLQREMKERQDYLRSNPAEAKPKSTIAILIETFPFALKGAWRNARVDAPTWLRIPLSICAIALVTAISTDMPHDFFVLLKVLTFVSCIACVNAFRKDGQLGMFWMWVIVMIAVIYNPLLPIQLKKGTWESVNMATLPLVCLLCFLIKSNQSPPPVRLSP